MDELTAIKSFRAERDALPDEARETIRRALGARMAAAAGESRAFGEAVAGASSPPDRTAGRRGFRSPRRRLLAFAAATGAAAIVAAALVLGSGPTAQPAATPPRRRRNPPPGRRRGERPRGPRRPDDADPRPRRIPLPEGAAGRRRG